MSFTGKLTCGIMAKAVNPFNLRFGNAQARFYPRQPKLHYNRLTSSF